MSSTKYMNYIDGKWTLPTTDQYYENQNPADTSQVIGLFPLSSAEDVNMAVESANKAFPAWSRLLPNERENYFKKFVALLNENKQKIGEALCLEEGKTLKEAVAEPIRGVSECTYLMGEGQRLEGITMPSDRKGVVSVANRIPLGVVAAIAPWNFPFLTPLRKVMPALVAGNTVVFKPAFETPMCGVLLMDLFDKAGFPAGVVNMVIGRGSEIGDALSANPLVRGITFTGSTEVGRRINTVAAKNFTKVQLEMGGKNPAIVVGYKNLDYAASQIASAAYAVAGQRCTSISRVIVQKDHAEELENLIVEKMKTYVMGNGLDPKTTVGPIINKEAGQKILGYIESAKTEGATIKYGGKQLTGGEFDKGIFIEPTLITNVTPSMKVAVDEIFGPVLVSIKVDSYEEALSVANDSKYGLAACLFTDSMEYTYDFMQNMQSGMVHLNHGTVTDGNMPFGGVKSSGLGNFSKGKTNKDFFTTLKVIYTKYSSN